MVSLMPYLMFDPISFIFKFQYAYYLFVDHPSSVEYG